jgi:hypothetical protein
MTAIEFDTINYKLKKSTKEKRIEKAKKKKKEIFSLDLDFRIRIKLQSRTGYNEPAVPRGLVGYMMNSIYGISNKIIKFGLPKSRDSSACIYLFKKKKITWAALKCDFITDYIQ